MKRISLLSTVGVLAVATILPSTVAAAYPPTYTTRVLKAVCTNVNGQYGFGKVILGVKATAYNNIPDRPTPNYIVLVNRRQEKVGDAWLTVAKSKVTSPVSADDYGQLTNTLQEAVHFETADHPKTRMIMRIEFWDDLPSGDVRLETLTHRTDGC